MRALSSLPTWFMLACSFSAGAMSWQSLAIVARLLP